MNKKGLILTNRKRRDTGLVESLDAKMRLGLDYCSEGVGRLRMVYEDALLEVGPCWALREDTRAGKAFRLREAVKKDEET